MTPWQVCASKGTIKQWWCMSLTCWPIIKLFHDLVSFYTHGKYSRGYRKWSVVWNELTTNYYKQITHLIHTHMFPKNYFFYPLPRTRACAYQGETNVSFFPENFAYVLNKWSLTRGVVFSWIYLRITRSLLLTIYFT